MNNRKLLVNMVVIREDSTAAYEGLTHAQLEKLAAKKKDGEKIVLYTPMDLMLLEEKGNLMLPKWDATICLDGQALCNEHALPIGLWNIKPEKRLETCVRRLQKYWKQNLEIRPLVI